MIPYGKQNIDKSDIEAVVKVLKSDFITQGPTTPEFEKQISKKVNAKYSCAVNSATSALHISCLALGIGKDDIVWTSPVSFVASSNCAIYCGATVDFVDIDKTSYNICVHKLEKKLIKADRIGKLPKAVIAVHLSGQSCDMKEINKLSKKYNFKIIEDASHAIGGKYLGEPIGNCKFSDISVFSFHPVKIITTCEGGICTTNDPKLYSQLCRFRSHGITRQPKEMINKPDGSWYYEQLDLGYNFRLNDLMSALGLSQLEKLDKFIKEREKIAKIYNSLLSETSVVIPEQSLDTNSSRHLYIIRVPKERNLIFEHLRNNGIGVNIHYIPIYRQPFYKKYNYNYNDFPEAEAYYREAISIPIFPGLTKMQQEKIIKIIQDPPGFQNLF
jgi:UDP-4-amino-4,6-dideoxy-N-acetyl-beta-L-altrosamine transaminase